MTVFQIILLGAGASFFSDILMCLMNGGRIVAKTSGGKRIRLRHFTRKHTVGMTVMAIVIGVLVGLAHYAPLAGAKSETPELGPVWGCIFFVSMMILFVAVTLWFVSNVRRWSELLWFAILATFIMWAAQSAVHVMALWWESRVLSWIFFVVPWMIFAIAIGFPAFVLAIRFFYAGRGAVWRVIAVILAITTIASAIVIAACGNQIAGLPSKAKAVETKSTEKTMSAPPEQKKEDFWCVFYNDECQKNNNVDDDLNFGLNPYEKGMSAAKLAEIHRRVMLTDPANGTAAMCWLDKHVGTRYMGDKFYDEYAGKDDAAINAAKEVYIENEKLYKDTMSAFLAYMDRATVEIREVKGHLEDQMYMIPGRMSVRGVPDVAVFKSGEQGGHYLVYIFTIKNKVVEVPFRVECLFQPTNVTEYLKVTVKEKPSTATYSSGGGSSSSGGGTGSSPNDPTSTPQDPTSPVVTPTQVPTQPSTYNKDKSKSDNSGENDNPGEGESTNNGVGATTSTKDKSTNSDHITSSEYVQKIEELKDVNSSQKTGKDDSTPSTKTSNTKVDNNGAEANKPAAQAPREPEVAGDSSNQYWDGSGI